jgi:hypothetical protein
MATIDLSAIDERKIQDLAARAVLKGVLVEYVGECWQKSQHPQQVGESTSRLNRVKAYDYELTSVSDPTRFHSVSLWRDGDKWMASCDEGVAEGCEANQLGNRVCGHVAVAFNELKKQQQKQVA